MALEITEDLASMALLTEDEKNLVDATRGFDAVFNDDIVRGKEILSGKPTPFHLLGYGITVFLQAALGMEDGLMAEASKALSEAEAAAKKASKSASSKKSTSQFPPGIEWELMQTDAVLLLGITQALSESYYGYLQCMYSLNSAHSRFGKIYKTVFPKGIDAYPTPGATPIASSRTTPAVSRQASTSNLSLNVPSTTVSSSSASSTRSGLLGRFLGSSTTSLTSTKEERVVPKGPIDELIIYGSAFGFGLFNLVFSLLPAKVKRLVGFFGFQSDRQLALQALAVAAAGKDAHSSFAALTLMTYHGVKLLMGGYLTDEAHLLKQIGAMLDSLQPRFPHGSLWLLNRAKLARYERDPARAIEILKDGLSPSRPIKFQQADALLMFELAWVLLAERRYPESAEAFLKMTELNTWSHPTYYFLAAGCYLAVNTEESRSKAQELFDALPELLQKKKMGGKDLPTEVYVMKKVDFWKRKQTRWYGPEKRDRFVDCIRINPAEELAVFWNTHGKVPKATAEAHIKEFISLTPVINVGSPYQPQPTAPTEPERDDLDTADELRVRDLILGITHRAAGEHVISRKLLEAASQDSHELEGKWVISMAYFELAVLDMHEVVAQTSESSPVGKEEWMKAITAASSHLDKASSHLGDTDLSSRLDARINMMRDELNLKRETL